MWYIWTKSYIILYIYTQRYIIILIFAFFGEYLGVYVPLLSRIVPSLSQWAKSSPLGRNVGSRNTFLGGHARGEPSRGRLPKNHGRCFSCFLVVLCGKPMENWWLYKWNDMEHGWVKVKNYLVPYWWMAMGEYTVPFSDTPTTWSQEMMVDIHHEILGDVPMNETGNGETLGIVKQCHVYHPWLGMVCTCLYHLYNGDDWGDGKHDLVLPTTNSMSCFCADAKSPLRRWQKWPPSVQLQVEAHRATMVLRMETRAAVACGRGKLMMIPKGSMVICREANPPPQKISKMGLV